MEETSTVTPKLPVPEETEDEKYRRLSAMPFDTLTSTERAFVMSYRQKQTLLDHVAIAPSASDVQDGSVTIAIKKLDEATERLAAEIPDFKLAGEEAVRVLRENEELKVKLEEFKEKGSRLERQRDDFLKRIAHAQETETHMRNELEDAYYRLHQAGVKSEELANRATANMIVNTVASNDIEDLKRRNRYLQSIS